MTSPSDSNVDRVYAHLRAMAVSYGFRPGERLNEGELARTLGVSRTPLREALNRLNTEGFLRFAPGKGFFCRELDAQEVFDLYETRKALELASAQLAIRRATPEQVADLLAFLDRTGPDPGTRSAVELVAFDERFHEGLMRMSGNAEMLRVLRNVNARIRFVRWIDMDRINRAATQREHRDMLLAIEARDETTCLSLMERHIDRRLDQITAAIKEGYAQIYMPAPGGGGRPPHGGVMEH